MPNLVELFQKQGAQIDVTPDPKFRHRSPGSPAKESPLSWTCKRTGSREAIDKVERQQAEEQRLALQEKQDLKRKLDSESAGIIDPALMPKVKQGRGGGRTRTGVKTGIAAGLKSNRRELGAPVLRRDPSAAAKLHMVMFIQKLMQEAKVKTINEVPSRLRKVWEARGV